MKFLTFDTALNKTYISLGEDNSFTELLTIENSEDKYHSAFLIQEIANILKKNKLTMQDINAVGINIGPGSFTGIRACTTVGRVIAQQIEIPLVPVSSLEILAKINSKEGETLTTLDARKGLAFYAIYENGKEIKKPQIIKTEDLYNLISTKKYTVVADGTMYSKLIENGCEAINYEAENYPLNKYLAEITYEKLNTCSDIKNEYNWAKVKPLYIQPPSVFGGTPRANS